MHFNFSVYSSILLIFFCQGIIFSFLLLKKGILFSSRPSNWLSLFTFFCSLYIVPWMLGFAGWYGPQPYRDIMFYVPFQQLFLIGPVIYFYTQSLLNPSFKLTRAHWKHLVPGMLYLMYRLIVFLTDKVILNSYYFYENGRDKNLDTWYQVTGFISMVTYFILCLRYYSVYKKVIYETVSFAEALLFGWIKKYLVAFLLMQALWLMFFLFYPGWGNFKEKWWYYLAFSSIMYYIYITGYSNHIKALIPFKIETIDSKLVYSLENDPPEITQQTTTGEVLAKEPADDRVSEQIASWKTKIIETMEQDRLYENPNLTLLDIAQKLDTNQTLISKMINQGFKMNFNDFVNYHRIKAVIGLFERQEHKKQTLLGIALECGFNSKTTFNRCFKKYTQMSPKEFLMNAGKTDQNVKQAGDSSHELGAIS